MVTAAGRHNTKFKKITVSAGIAGFLLFCIFVVFYEDHTRKEARAKIDEHARVIADALWNYNYEAVSEYLNLACQSYNYAALSVVEAEGRGVFYDAPVMETGAFEGLLMAARLMPAIPLESNVLYQGRTIGSIEAVWVSRAIYTHAVVFVFFIMGFAVFLLYVRILQANQMLEQRVIQRTSALAAANTLLKNEISEREEIETTLRRSEENLRTTLDSIGDGVIVAATDGMIVRVNPVAQKLTGWQIAEAVGQPLSEVFHIVDARTREKLDDPVGRVLAAGTVVDLAEHTLLLASDGKEYQVADSGAPIRDHYGNITGVVLVFRDVSEDYRMREALRESERQLRKAQSVARLGSWQVDIETGNTILCDQACGIYGIDDCAGKSNRALRHIPLPEYRPMLAEKLKRLLRRESDYEEAEFKIKRPKDGLVRDIYTAGEYNPNRHIVEGIIQDITERKQAELELQKMENLKTVGMLAGGIAHDFNNILTGIFGNMSVARSRMEKGHPAINPLEEAERSMDRAIRLTNQLLTFSKGGYPVKEDARLDQIVEEVVRFDLSGSNVKPVFQSAINLWLAKVDKGQVQQVFSNLAINADHAMPKGGRLHIALENAEVSETSTLPLAPGKYIKAVVRDEGVGIEPMHLEHIFDPYYSIRQNGTGLGLATVYSVINKHGGHIRVSSEPSEGTTFTLYLPASEATRPEAIGRPETQAKTLQYAARILVMDDEEIIRNVISDMLIKCGCEVKTAADGKAAVEMYRAAMASGAPFDMIIMDVTVPGGMGGMEAVKEILAFDPRVRAVVSSGYADNVALGKYEEYGFIDILSKPYTLDRLYTVLNRVLQA